MRQAATVAACALLAQTLVAVEVGDARADVLAELGAPSGSAVLGERELLFYAHGTVDLRGGTVVGVELRSPSEQAAWERAEAARREQHQRAAASLADERRAQGETWRRHLLHDPGTLTSPAAVQLDEWRRLARDHPDLPPDPEATARVKELAAAVSSEQARASELAFIQAARSSVPTAPAGSGTFPTPSLAVVDHQLGVPASPIYGWSTPVFICGPSCGAGWCGHPPPCGGPGRPVTRPMPHDGWSVRARFGSGSSISVYGGHGRPTGFSAHLTTRSLAEAHAPRGFGTPGHPTIIVAGRRPAG